MRNGLFISFEGGEGAGKSAQVEKVARRITEKGYTVVATREPGGTRIGTLIRAITHDPQNIDLRGITEAYLMATDRAQHVREVILPALEAGKIVISDRYIDSSIAYQGYGRKLGEQFIRDLNAFAIQRTMPDVTFLLDVDLEIGSKRRNESTKTDRLDLQVKTFYRDVKDGYQILARKEPKRFIVIDADKSIDSVTNQIWTNLEKIIDAWNGKKKK